ncbi:tetratricopeptide repeat protein [Limisalsivibrio acetivorans]|uniref:tetratricopeptide repeat protein n=1 Tax=Limisalsivibrio acetivorans TaxID=1304888 RepID=UPI0003B2E81F|nr:tetratricopeptide repeat protein [Limisalsivibrio acetivorans]
MKLIRILIPLFFLPALLFAEDIYLRQNQFFTELVISDIAAEVDGVSKDNNTITIQFKDPLAADFTGSLNDPFIKRIESGEQSITVYFAQGTDFVFTTEGANVKLVSSKKRELDDIKLGYGIESPIIRKGGEIIEDEESERSLGRVDELIASRNFDEAIVQLEGFLSNQPSEYYRQEALYRMGMAYFHKGEESYKNYVTAAKIFDDFIEMYPDSYRFRDALMRSAESKERAGMYYEAIFGYENIIKLVRDEEMQKLAYRRIAEIYEQLGQYDRAIEARENYVRRFPEAKRVQDATIGMLQSKRGDSENAFLNFQEFRGENTDFTDLSPEIIYSMGEVFKEKGENQDALRAYSKVFELFPSSEHADLAMYRAAEMNEELGNQDAADSLLVRARDLYPEKTGGLLASIKYADNHLTEKSPADWQKFLDNALKSEDFEVKSQAELVMIKAYYNEGDYDKTLSAIDDFARLNYSSPLMEEVFDIKQLIRLKQAERAYEEGKDNVSEQYINALLEEFPDSDYREDAERILQQIKYIRTRAKLDGGEFNKVISDVENFYANTERIYEPAIWNSLLDEAYYALSDRYLQNGQLELAQLSAKQYFVHVEEGEHQEEVRDIYEESLFTIMKGSFDDKRYLDVIRFYDDNSGMINGSEDQQFQDKLKAYAAFSLYKLTLPEKSAQIMDTIEYTDNPVYKLTNLLLGRGGIDFDVNGLDRETFMFIVDELEKQDVDKAIAVLDRYTKDPMLAEKLKFDITKNIFDDNKREMVLLDIYQDLNSTSKCNGVYRE